MTFETDEPVTPQQACDLLCSARNYLRVMYWHGETWRPISAADGVMSNALNAFIDEHPDDVQLSSLESLAKWQKIRERYDWQPPRIEVRTDV